MIQTIQNIANASQYSTSKVTFVNNVYWNMVAAGLRPAILNDKYIEIDGNDYEFIHSKKNGTYTVKVI